MENKSFAGMTVKVYSKEEYAALFPEAAKREAERQEYWRKQRERMPGESTALDCDGCKKHLGWVYECDLNGSYFYCDVCKEAASGANTSSEVSGLQSLDEELP